MDIYVTSLDKASDVAHQYIPASIISFIDPTQDPPVFKGYNRDTHLVMNFHDIALPRSGLKPASRQNMIVMMDFMLKHNVSRPLLIHCLMGVSRSAAAAYIFLNLHYQGRELEIAQYMRSKIPYAHPNIAMIEQCDMILGRDKKFTRAVSSLPASHITDAGDICKLSTDFI